jgi:hypothetical protein
VIRQDITQYELPIFYNTETADYDDMAAFYNITPEGNLSVDDGVTDLGNNYRILEVYDNGYVLLEKDFVQEINQDIIQDVYYEIDLVQDFIQTQNINQSYIVDEVITETRTRLAGE